jgi:hypothetical protein
MKASIVFATGLILAAGAVVGFSNAAHAGAGGSTGSISASFSTGNVLSATAGAVSVGKAGSITTATGNATTITASSVGYAGSVLVTDFNTAAVTYEVNVDTNAGLALSQGNNFAGTDKSGSSLLPGPTTGVSLK